MTEIQLITLRDVFAQAGLGEAQIHDVMLLLRFKPERVQLAFYYVATLGTQKAAAAELGVSQQTVGWYLKKCADVRRYLCPRAEIQTIRM